MFIIYPAIDLRKGKVVRLLEGDPARQTTYSGDPAETALRWIDSGAAWLHVVNLDGALDESDFANYHALQRMLSEASAKNVLVQFGGGLRTLQSIQMVLDLGVSRAILGTAAVENPHLVKMAVERFGDERISVSLDARSGNVQTHGWKSPSDIKSIDLARELKAMGLKTLVFTDISRDGKQTGINLSATQALAASTGLEIIASGGVSGVADVANARDANLAGIIIGKALYEKQIDLAAVISAYQAVG